METVVGSYLVVGLARFLHWWNSLFCLHILDFWDMGQSACYSLLCFCNFLGHLFSEQSVSGGDTKMTAILLSPQKIARYIGYCYLYCMLILFLIILPWGVAFIAFFLGWDLWQLLILFMAAAMLSGIGYYYIIRDFWECVREAEEERKTAKRRGRKW